jgi:hypothetical protein
MSKRGWRRLIAACLRYMRGPQSQNESYSSRAERQLKKGKPHRTLGGNLRDREFGISGSNLFQTLVQFGLKPEDSCVDYGCGTLRIGIHLIRYLNPGGYWGMDVSEFFLDEGRHLVGESLWCEKRPNLRIISAGSIAEAANAHPAMVLSNRVMRHVAPKALPEFLGNISRLIATSGQAIVTAHWTERAPISLRGGKSWAHTLSEIDEIVKAYGCSVEAIPDSTEAVQGITAGILRIRPDSQDDAQLGSPKDESSAHPRH